MGIEPEESSIFGSKYTKNVENTFFSKVRRIAQSYDPEKLPTEQMRAQLIWGLKALGEIVFEQTSKRINEGGKFTKNHQK